jgi:carbon-monoxide dehydrogenase medium subunit
LKLPLFDYASPTSVAEVVDLLVQHQGEARVISGGQSLMPMLAYRLATPSLIVDLRHVGGLDRIEINENGIELGAKVRMRDIEDNRLLATAHPLLVEAVKHVAHYQIRNRSTVGGSLAHADPAAELPAIAVTCDAKIVIAGPDGHRTVPAKEFFVGPMLTKLVPSEIIVALQLPAWQSRRSYGFQEFARRRGDFALAGVALFYDEEPGGRVTNPHIGAFGVDDVPLRLHHAERVLEGERPSSAVFARAVELAKTSITPQTDIHADADYRRALLGTMLERALQQAAGLSAAP